MEHQNFERKLLPQVYLNKESIMKGLGLMEQLPAGISEAHARKPVDNSSKKKGGL